MTDRFPSLWAKRILPQSVRRGLLAAAAFGLVAALPQGAAAAPVKVRYVEVVRALLYGPAYVALAKGYFRDAGLDVEMSTSQGGDKATAQILGGAADIMLAGPETAVYIRNGASPDKLKIFATLTGTDGLLLLSRKKIGKFDWSMLRGKTVIGWRPGSTPELFLEYVMRQHGVVPDKDAEVIKNLSIPARGGAFLAGRGDFAIFNEPEVSVLEKRIGGQVVASQGAEVGRADYTAFIATEKYIADHPAVVQAWTDAIYRGQKWAAKASPEELGQVLAPYFQGVPPAQIAASVKRFRSYPVDYWARDPMPDRKGLAKLQDIMVAGGVLKAAQRVSYKDLVDPRFAAKAMGQPAGKR